MSAIADSMIVAIMADLAGCFASSLPESSQIPG
jgi:hypothetical protein